MPARNTARRLTAAKVNGTRPQHPEQHAEVEDMTDARADRRETPREPLRVRLPAFIDDDVGLGDVITKVTYSARLRPCNGCTRRAATLNRWVTFTHRNHPH
ncbi:hypothetical protein [Streptomyces nigra]|uniref:hypothetical protein n=1 Tax=Streptomyces nigra TaxID=1827580 RepID=UPI0037FFC4E0